MAPENVMGEEMKSYRDLVMRCPRLGGEVPFSYCEREAGDLPCRQVVRCWETIFPVETCLRETMTPETWECFCEQVPKDRMTMLIDVVEAAKRRRKEGTGSSS
jgi:hypothetical protein